MAKTITLYQCNFCEHTLKTEAGIKKHEAHCKENPSILAISEGIEAIRTESTSVQDMITRLKDFLLTLGIKLHLTCYPSIYRDSISNTHNAPKGFKRRGWHSDNPDVPTGYPGWTGSWQGQVEVVDPSILVLKRTVYFSELLNGSAHKELRIDFIHTSSGGGGDKFDYNGMLFVYDFPKMHEEFLARGGAVSALTDHYEEVVNNYFYEFDQQCTKHVKSHDLSQQMKDLQEAVDWLSTSAKDATKKLKKNLITEFVEAYNVELPLPPDPFSLTEEAAKKIQSVTATSVATPAPELRKYIKRLNELTKEMQTMKENNPEYFL